ncbi:MAG: hypothetical protein COA38_08415, partial [Fluviicola sp.]
MIASNFIQFIILEFMKRFAVLLIFSGLGFWSSAQEIDMKRIDFVNKFNNAVVAHKQGKVIKLTDKGYRSGQIKFLDGNEKQYVNELFGGIDIHTEEYINLKLTDIENIEVQDVFNRGNGDWEYVFHIKSGEII